VLGARHYLPALGRWSSPDPYYLHNPAAHLDRPGERNLYRYAANNPVQHIDPTGHGWISWGIKIGKGAWKWVTKGYDKVDEFSGMVDDAATIVSTEAGIGSRVLSALSLGSEILPISAGDIKDGYRWFRGGDKLIDTAASARTSQRSVVDGVGDLAVTPSIPRKPGTANGPRAGMSFKPEHTSTLLHENRLKNNGRVLCENCGTELFKPQKSMRGVTPPVNEWQRDHIIPKIKRGDGAPSNGQLLCRTCNRAKGTK
jgi:RHS repeat-associated protein